VSDPKANTESIVPVKVRTNERKDQTLYGRDETIFCRRFFLAFSKVRKIGRFKFAKGRGCLSAIHRYLTNQRTGNIGESVLLACRPVFTAHWLALKEMLVFRAGHRLRPVFSVIYDGNG
jgi:hypothetical protein